MKEEFPNGEQQHATKPMNRPFDKTFEGVNQTTTHPHSELKLNQKKYYLLDEKAVSELNKERQVHNYGSDFKSTLIQHPPHEKYTNFNSVYKQSFQQNDDGRVRAVSTMNYPNVPAGDFNPTPE